MDEPVERVRQRVDNKELPHVVIDGTVMIPALAVRDFYYDYLLKARKKGKEPGPKTKDAPDTSAAPNVRKAAPEVPAEKHRGTDMDAATRATGTETGREFRGATIEEAVSAASKALGVREEEIGNFAEVVDRGYKGFLGAGKRDARIKLRAAERPGKERGVGPTRGEETNRPFASTELASVKEIVDLPADKALDGAGQSRTFGCTLGTLVALS
jgi:hypothetical protein